MQVREIHAATLLLTSLAPPEPLQLQVWPQGGLQWGDSLLQSDGGVSDSASDAGSGGLNGGLRPLSIAEIQRQVAAQLQHTGGPGDRSSAGRGGGRASGPGMSRAFKAVRSAAAAAAAVLSASTSLATASAAPVVVGGGS